MQASRYDIYTQFLLECKKVMGSLDLDRLAYDEAYKIEFIRRVSTKASHLFEIAGIVDYSAEQTLN